MSGALQLPPGALAVDDPIFRRALSAVYVRGLAQGWWDGFCLPSAELLAMCVLHYVHLHTEGRAGSAEAEEWRSLARQLMGDLTILAARRVAIGLIDADAFDVEIRNLIA